MPNNIFAVAFKLHALGFSVIPSGGSESGKAPIVNWTEYQQRQPGDAELEAWQRELKPNLWGIVTGAISGVVVVDADNAETRATIESNGLKPHIITPRGGAHFYFKHPGHHVKTIAGLLPKIDVRGDGGFVNVVGRRVDGEYKIVILPTPDTIYSWDKLPEEVKKALEPKPRTLGERILQEALGQAQPGNRNNVGLWLACQLRDNGLSQSETEAVMLRYVAQIGDLGPEPYTEQEAMASLEQAYKQPAREPWHTAQPLPETTLPEIVVNGRHLRDQTADALEALYKANQPERIFRRGGMLVRISLDEKRRPSIEALNADSFRGYLTRSANFKRVGKIKEEWVETKVAPPMDVVKDCLSLGNWQFPALAGITEVPVLRPDGTVLTKAGYDRSTNLYYYRLPDLAVPVIPDSPSEAEIKTAIDLVLEPLADFPFDSEASRANGIAAMITPILRPLIDSPLPLAVFDKPQAGTGASLLAEVINLITTGRPAAMMPPPKNEEEWNKVITVTVLKGHSVMVIDNIENKLQSPSLATLLTARIWRGRILGRSEDIMFPNIITPIATGNNIQLGGDLPRRCIWVRMDAKIPQPWLRPEDTFEHSNLPKWVSENRGAILGAILIIARAWIVAGMPEAKGLLNLGTYESYCRIVGGVLAFMGIEGFLDNLNAMYDEMDAEAQQWEAFLEAWLEYVGEEPVTGAEVAKILDDKEDFKSSLPYSLTGKDSRDYSRRLGNALSKQNGVRYPNGLMVIKAGHKRTPAIAWQVLSYEKANLAPLATNTKLAKLDSTLFARGEKEEVLYKECMKTNLANLPLATKSGENAKLAKSGEVFFADTVDIEAFYSKPCPVCEGNDFWLSPDGRKLCNKCNPSKRR